MKQNYYHNGDLHKRQHEVIPKGKRLQWIQELRLWILVDKRLTEAEVKAKELALVTRYQEDQVKIFKY